jgi:hypothetical protein
MKIVIENKLTWSIIGRNSLAGWNRTELPCIIDIYIYKSLENNENKILFLVRIYVKD